MSDLIDRQAAIDALWKALHDYEDKTEKQFQESDELDVWDWINHREFVQCMNDIDRATIFNLPSAQPEIIQCKDCKYSEHWYRDKRRCFLWVEDGIDVFDDGFCNYAKRRTDEEEQK